MESCQPVILTPLQPHLCLQTGHATRYMGTSWQSEVETLSSELAECSTTGAPLYLMWTFWSIFHFYILVWVDPCSPYFACICSTSHQQYHSLVYVQGIHYFFFDNLKKKSVRIFTGCFFSLDSVKNYKSAILRMNLNIRSSIILCFFLTHLNCWMLNVCITAQSTSLRAETVDGVRPAWPHNITAAIHPFVFWTFPDPPWIILTICQNEEGLWSPFRQLSLYILNKPRWKPQVPSPSGSGSHVLGGMHSAEVMHS